MRSCRITRHFITKWLWISAIHLWPFLLYVCFYRFSISKTMICFLTLCSNIVIKNTWNENSWKCQRYHKTVELYEDLFTLILFPFPFLTMSAFMLWTCFYVQSNVLWNVMLYVSYLLFINELLYSCLCLFFNLVYCVVLFIMTLKNVAALFWNFS